MRYVAGFMMDEDRDLILVRKTKPDWQAGRLNGIGGKIEKGEEAYEAMCREWREETGNSWSQWKRMAMLTFPNGTVFFFKALVPKLPNFPEFNDSGERLEIHPYDKAVRYDDMIQNLKWLLPLAFEDPDDTLVINPSYAYATA